MNGSALIGVVFALAVYGALRHRAAPEDPASPSRAGNHASPSDQEPSLAQRLAAEPLTAAECAEWLGKSATAEISGRLRGLDRTFWTASPNATILLDAAFAQVAAERGAFAAAMQAIEFVKAAPIGEVWRGALFEAAFSGAFRSGVPDSAGMVQLLKAAGLPAASNLLTAYLSARPSSGSMPLEARAEELWRAAGLPSDEAALVQLSRDLAPGIALRGNVEEAFAAVGYAEYSDERRIALGGVARVLRKANPEGFKSFIGMVAKIDLPGRDAPGRAAAEACTDCLLDYSKLPALAKSLPNELQSDFWQHFCRSLRDENPAETDDLATAVPARELPDDARPALCGDLCGAGAGRVSHWLQGFSPEETAEILDHSLNDLRNSTAGNAWFELRAGLPGLNEYTMLMPFNMTGLAEEDRTSLLGIAEKLPAGPRNKVIERIFEDSPETLENLRLHRAEEMARINALPKEIQTAVRRSVLQKLASFDPREALKESAAAGDDGLRHDVLNGLLAWSSPDFSLDQRRDLLLERLGTDSDPGRYGAGVAALEKQYARSDPSKGAQLCAALPAGPLYDAAVGSLAGVWSAADPAAAADWIGALPPGRARDLAVETLTGDLLNDPQAALGQAAGIADPELRLQAAAQVVKAWRLADLNGVCQIASDAGFSDEEILALRNSVHQSQTTAVSR